MKRFLCLIIMVLFCFNLPSIAKADGTSVEVLSKKPTKGIKSPYLDYGRGYSLSNNNISIQANNIILTGNNYIQRLSGKEISGYAKTLTDIKVDTIGYIMKFQVWNGHSWVNYAESFKKGYNNNSVSGFHDKRVTPGRYYRLKVIHYYEHNGVFKSITTYSEYIYLNYVNNIALCNPSTYLIH